MSSAIVYTVVWHKRMPSAAPSRPQPVDLLRASLVRLLASDKNIAMATDDELQGAVEDSAADPLVREQAAAVLQARAALNSAAQST